MAKNMLLTIIALLAVGVMMADAHDGDRSEHALSVFQHSHLKGEGDHYDLPHASEEHDALTSDELVGGCEGLHNHITSKLKTDDPPQKPPPPFGSDDVILKPTGDDDDETSEEQKEDDDEEGDEGQDDDDGDRQLRSDASALSGTLESDDRPKAGIRVTEIMYRTWRKGGGALNGFNPQWIEVHNFSTITANLKGWRVVIKQSPEIIYRVDADFMLSAGGTRLLVSKKVMDRMHSVNAKHVYNLNIPIRTHLKGAWQLIDANGTMIFQRNGHETLGVHDAGGQRVSVKILPSTTPSKALYYGHEDDNGHPTFHSPVAPASPSLHTPKLTTLWGALKQRQ